MTTGQQEKDARIEGERAKVLHAVATGLHRAAEIVKVTGLNERNVDRALQALRKQKKLVFRTVKQSSAMVAPGWSTK